MQSGSDSSIESHAVSTATKAPSSDPGVIEQLTGASSTERSKDNTANTAIENKDRPVASINHSEKISASNDSEAANDAEPDNEVAKDDVTGVSPPQKSAKIEDKLSNKPDTEGMTATNNTPDKEVSTTTSQSEGPSSPVSPNTKGLLCPQCIRRFPSAQALATHVCKAVQFNSVGSVWRERLQAFYQLHNPVKLKDDGFVDEVLQYYIGREEQLMAKLVSQYGPERNAVQDGSGSSSSGQPHASDAASSDNRTKHKAGPVDGKMDDHGADQRSQLVSSTAVAPPVPSALSSQLRHNAPTETAQSNTTTAPTAPPRRSRSSTAPPRRSRSSKLKSKLSALSFTHCLQYDLEDIDIFHRDHNMQVSLGNSGRSIFVVFCASSFDPQMLYISCTAPIYYDVRCRA